MPVSIDQKASNKMAANAQNLYRPRPNKVESMALALSFLEDVADVADVVKCAVGVDTGRASSSFISILLDRGL